MAMTIATLPTEVTFITPTGPMEIRMSEHTPEAIQSAAKALKARLYVTVVEWDRTENLPVWAVMATASGEIIKQFTTESSAPAVMFASIRRAS